MQTASRKTAATEHKTNASALVVDAALCMSFMVASPMIMASAIVLGIAKDLHDTFRTRMELI